MSRLFTVTIALIFTLTILSGCVDAIPDDTASIAIDANQASEIRETPETSEDSENSDYHSPEDIDELIRKGTEISIEALEPDPTQTGQLVILTPIKP